MIAWINGPFGVGKSTVAERLAREWPGATLFDPELLGYLLRTWTPPDVVVDDFQDLPVWRALVRTTARGLLEDLGRPLVVPMTLLHPPYHDEVVGGLVQDGIDVRHVCLTARRGTVLARARARDGAVNPFIGARFDSHERSLRDPRFATFVATDDRDEDEVYREVRRALGPLPTG